MIHSMFIHIGFVDHERQTTAIGAMFHACCDILVCRWSIGSNSVLLRNNFCRRHRQFGAVNWCSSRNNRVRFNHRFALRPTEAPVRFAKQTTGLGIPTYAKKPYRADHVVRAGHVAMISEADSGNLEIHAFLGVPPT